MKNVESQITVIKPDWGLIKTSKLIYKDTPLVDNQIPDLNKKIKKVKKKDLFRKVRDKFGNSMVVKLDFSCDTAFILLCNL